MKVKELIELLTAEDPEADVSLCVEANLEFYGKSWINGRHDICVNGAISGWVDIEATEAR